MNISLYLYYGALTHVSEIQSFAIAAKQTDIYALLKAKSLDYKRLGDDSAGDTIFVGKQIDCSSAGLMTLRSNAGGKVSLFAKGSLAATGSSALSKDNPFMTQLEGSLTNNLTSITGQINTSTNAINLALGSLLTRTDTITNHIETLKSQTIGRLTDSFSFLDPTKGALKDVQTNIDALTHHFNTLLNPQALNQQIGTLKNELETLKTQFSDIQANLLSQLDAKIGPLKPDGQLMTDASNNISNILQQLQALQNNNIQDLLNSAKIKFVDLQEQLTNLQTDVEAITDNVLDPSGNDMKTIDDSINSLMTQLNAKSNSDINLDTETLQNYLATMRDDVSKLQTDSLKNLYDVVDKLRNDDAFNTIQNEIDAFNSQLDNLLQNDLVSMLQLLNQKATTIQSSLQDIKSTLSTKMDLDLFNPNSSYYTNILSQLNSLNDKYSALKVNEFNTDIQYVQSSFSALNTKLSDIHSMVSDTNFSLLSPQNQVYTNIQNNLTLLENQINENVNETLNQNIRDAKTKISELKTTIDYLRNNILLNVDVSLLEVDNPILVDLENRINTAFNNISNFDNQFETNYQSVKNKLSDIANQYQTLADNQLVTLIQSLDYLNPNNNIFTDLKNQLSDLSSKISNTDAVYLNNLLQSVKDKITQLNNDYSYMQTNLLSYLNTNLYFLNPTNTQINEIQKYLSDLQAEINAKATDTSLTPVLNTVKFNVNEMQSAVISLEDTINKNGLTFISQEVIDNIANDIQAISAKVNADLSGNNLNPTIINTLSELKNKANNLTILLTDLQNNALRNIANTLTFLNSNQQSIITNLKTQIDDLSQKVNSNLGIDNLKQVMDIINTQVSTLQSEFNDLNEILTNQLNVDLLNPNSPTYVDIANCITAVQDNINKVDITTIDNTISNAKAQLDNLVQTFNDLKNNTLNNIHISFIDDNNSTFTNLENGIHDVANKINGDFVNTLTDNLVQFKNYSNDLQTKFDTMIDSLRILNLSILQPNSPEMSALSDQVMHLSASINTYSLTEVNDVITSVKTQMTNLKTQITDIQNNTLKNINLDYLNPDGEAFLELNNQINNIVSNLGENIDANTVDDLISQVRTQLNQLKSDFDVLKGSGLQGIDMTLNNQSFTDMTNSLTNITNNISSNADLQSYLDKMTEVSDLVQKMKDDFNYIKSNLMVNLKGIDTTVYTKLSDSLTSISQAIDNANGLGDNVQTSLTQFQLFVDGWNKFKSDMESTNSAIQGNSSNLLANLSTAMATLSLQIENNDFHSQSDNMLTTIQNLGSSMLGLKSQDIASINNQIANFQTSAFDSMKSQMSGFTSQISSQVESQINKITSEAAGMTGKQADLLKNNVASAIVKSMSLGGITNSTMERSSSGIDFGIDENEIKSKLPTVGIHEQPQYYIFVNYTL